MELAVAGPQDPAAVHARRGHQECHARRHRIRVQFVRLAFHAPHAGLGHRRHRVDHDAMRRTLGSQHVDDAHRCQLGRGIGGQPLLHVLRVQRTVGGGEHDATVAVGLHRGPRGFGQPQRCLGGERHHAVEVIIVQCLDGLVLHPPGVVDDEIQPAVALQDAGDQGLAVGAGVDAAVCRMHAPPALAQQCDRAGNPLRVVARAVQPGTHVVHHHLCTTLG